MGRSQITIGTDNDGLLHIRIIDQQAEKLMDTDETRLPATQAGAISTLKKRLPGLLPPHVPTAFEKAMLVGAATSIVGYTTEPDRQGWPFLAMAHQRLGHSAEARHWLDRLRANRADQSAGMRGGEHPSVFWDDLEFQLLQSEAEAVILYDPVFPADPFAPPAR